MGRSVRSEPKSFPVEPIWEGIELVAGIFQVSVKLNSWQPGWRWPKRSRPEASNRHLEITSEDESTPLKVEVLAGANAAAEPKRVRKVRSFILVETIRNMVMASCSLSMQTEWWWWPKIFCLNWRRICTLFFCATRAHGGGIRNSFQSELPQQKTIKKSKSKKFTYCSWIVL